MGSFFAEVRGDLVQPNEAGETLKPFKLCVGLGVLVASALILLWSFDRPILSLEPESSSTLLTTPAEAKRGLPLSKKLSPEKSIVPEQKEPLVKAPDAFADFEQWMDKFAKADAAQRSTLEGIGRGLAYKRREAMLDLIQ